MIILAADIGRSRTGLAVCDKDEILASPVEVIHEKDMEALCRRIAGQAAALSAELIVVGHPRNMDGSSGFKAEECRRAAARVGELCGLPVELYDERLTTVMAAGALNETNVRGRKRKNTVDAVAAVIILEDFIRHRKNQNG